MWVKRASALIRTNWYNKVQTGVSTVRVKEILLDQLVYLSLVVMESCMYLRDPCSNACTLAVSHEYQIAEATSLSARQSLGPVFIHDSGSIRWMNENPFCVIRTMVSVICIHTKFRKQKLETGLKDDITLQRSHGDDKFEAMYRKKPMERLWHGSEKIKTTIPLVKNRKVMQLQGSSSEGTQSPTA